MFRSLFRKLGETFEAFSFYFLNFEKIWGSEIGYCMRMEPIVLNLGSAYAGLA